MAGKNVSLIDLSESTDGDLFSQTKSFLEKAHVILDGILGIGTKLPIRQPIKTFLSEFELLGLKKAKIFSIDVPSGVNSDTGEFESFAVRPDITIALGFLKPCHAMQPSVNFCGDIVVRDIGLPSNLDFPIQATLLSEENVSFIVPNRKLSSHKGDFGKAIVVGGSDNYIGAPVLAASAALRSGLGLVTIAAYDALVDTMATMLSEATFLRLKGLDSDLLAGTRMARQIVGNLDGHNVLLIGCGFGVSRISSRIFESLALSGYTIPQLILDADGLNILSKINNWWDRLPAKSILTPHPKEMSRLTGMSVSQIQSDRLNVAKRFAKEWQVTLVLKGANTVIAEPDGNAFISPFANPILSSAGTGDVLSGFIAGFIGQGSTALEAACLGVYTHAKTAEVISNKVGSSGMLAGDLVEEVSTVIKLLRDRNQFGAA